MMDKKNANDKTNLMPNRMPKMRLGTVGAYGVRLIAVLLALAAFAPWSAPAMGQEEKKAEKKTEAKSPIQVAPIPAAQQIQPGIQPFPIEAPPVPDSPLKEVDPNAKQPIISVNELAHDFGSSWVGPKLEHTFKVTNKGSEPLEILTVRPACGCTIAGAYPKKLAPGETGDFPFSIDSNKVRGRYEKSITVTSNDPVNSDIRLKLRGECKRYLDIMPPAANFGRIYGTDKQERILNVTNNTDNALTLELDVPPDSKFDFKLVEIEAGKKYEIHVGVAPTGQSVGMVRTDATLKTNVESQKTIEVAATATIPTRLDLVPNSIVLPSTPEPNTDARPTTRIVRFTNYGDSPANVLEVSVDDPQITVTLSERTAGKNYDLRIEVPAGYTPSTDRTLTIKTDDKEFPTLAVPIKGQPSRVVDKTPPKRPAEQMLGKPVPAFNATTAEGKALSSETLSEAVTVMDFFAVNCGFCLKQIPRVETIRQEYQDKGVRFVAVNQTMNNKRFTDEEVKDKINTLGFKGELLIDSDNKIGPLFAATSFPTMAILGKSGKVEAVNLGNLGDLETRMKGQLDALLAGKPVPTFEDTAVAQTPPKRPAEELVGQNAPAFDLKTTEGKPLNNESASTAITVLDFFAVNCGFCGKQIPRVEAVRQEYESKGVRFVAVSQTMRQPFTDEEVKNKINTFGFKGELAIDSDNKVGPLFKANSFPTMTILGKSGKVEAVNVGNLGDLETRLKGQLDALLAGKPVPTFADAAPPAAQQPPRRPAEEMAGKPAPTFTVATLDGKTVSSADFAYHPATVLNFVAPNCGFCKKQMPNVEKVRAEYEAKGIRFVNVSQTMRKEFTPEEAADVFKQAGSHLELAIDKDNAIGTQFQATSYPTMMVVGKDGKVAHVNVGAKQDLEQVLKGQLDTLITGKPTADATMGKPAAAPLGTKENPIPITVGESKKAQVP